MKKCIACLALLLWSWGANAQVESGTVVESGRKLTVPAVFTIDAATEGTVIVELAVNREGNVTSSKVIREGTTVVSTPQIMKAQNISKKLKFTPGTHFAEFEHVRVRYTYVKK